MFLLAFTAASALAGTQAYQTTVEVRGTPVAVTYRAATTVSYRQVGGVSPPGVPNTQRCLWDATVAINREAAHAGVPIAALSRQVSSGKRINGSRPGSCHPARAAIAREVDARSVPLNDHLIEAAQRDRPDLLAELESVPILATRLG